MRPPMLRIKGAVPSSASFSVWVNGVYRDPASECAQLLGLDWVALPTAFPHTHPQRDHHEFDVFGGLRMPGDDALRKHVNDERDVAPAGPGAAIGEVHHPGVMRP